MLVYYVIKRAWLLRMIQQKKTLKKSKKRSAPSSFTIFFTSFALEGNETPQISSP